ncbi:unnamed protein product [Orchesella dallaii]|uniref:Uncharacterized protein n=1 Tax=Orchesella dallaii TaxID=48710 RepID=A0ABP1PLI7_9HEXA
MSTTENLVKDLIAKSLATTSRVTVLPADPVESKSNWFSENPVLTTSIVFLLIVLGCVIYVKCGKKRKNPFQNENLHSTSGIFTHSSTNEQHASENEPRTDIIAPSAPASTQSDGPVIVDVITHQDLPERKWELKESSSPAPPSIGWTIPIGWVPSHGEPFRNDNQNWGLAEFPRSSQNENVSEEPRKLFELKFW